MTAAALLAELRDAFPPTPIASTGAFDQRGRLYCDVPDYIAAMEGKAWDQLDPIFFARRSDGLDFLDDEHLAAVLPFYLQLLIALPPSSPVSETLLPLLTRPDPTDATKLFDWQRRRFEGLTARLDEPQKRMVARALLRFIADAPGEALPAARALERYWSDFA